MKKHFITNLALLIALNFLIKPFWFFGIEVSVQNRVGDEMYGFYFSLFSWAFIWNILLDMGINNFNNRAISREPGLVPNYLGSIIPLKLILALVYGLVVFVSAHVLNYDREQIRLLWIIMGNQFLSMFILYFRTNISGMQYYRTDSLLSVLDKSLMILFTGLLLWGNITREPFRIEWFVYAQTLSYVLTLLLTIGITRHRAGPFMQHISLKGSMNILRMSYPFALLILMMSLFNRVDSVMLERMLPHGRSEAGVYAQSFRILDAASQFPLLFSMLLLPMFSRMIKLKSNVNELVRTALPLLLVAALTLAIAGNAYKHEIINQLYPDAPGYSGNIFGWLMIGFVFISISYIYGTLLTANHNLKQMNLLAASTVVLNLLLNVFLIPRYHATGAAISSVISQAYYGLVQVLLSRKFLRTPWNADILLRLGAFVLFNLLGAFLLKNIPGWLPGFGLLILACLLSSLLLGLIRPAEIIKVVREKS